MAGYRHVKPMELGQVKVKCTAVLNLIETIPISTQNGSHLYSKQFPSLLKTVPISTQNGSHLYSKRFPSLLKTVPISTQNSLKRFPSPLKINTHLDDSNLYS